MQEVMLAGCQTLASYSAASCITSSCIRRSCRCRQISPLILKLLWKSFGVGLQSCRCHWDPALSAFGQSRTACFSWSSLCDAACRGRPRKVLRNLANTGLGTPHTLAAAVASTTDDQTANERRAYKDLALYGVDETDYDFLQNPQPDRHLIVKAVSKAEVKADDVSVAGPVRTPAASHHTRAIRKQESDVHSSGWMAYVLLSCDEQSTLVGVTSDLPRRLRQQNGHIKGGAKSSSAGRPWRVVCTVKGFGSKSEAFQFEWAWENSTKKVAGQDGSVPEQLLKWCKYFKSPAVVRCLAALEDTRTNPEFTSLHVEWHVDDEAAFKSSCGLDQ